MIKFFRHIRKELMEQNKKSKYFKYAIGEIIRVVIGILIALQINNWNENRLKNETVKTYLSNLIQDLKVDQRALNAMNEIHNFKFHSMQYLLNMEGSNPYDPIADRKKNIPPFIKSSYWESEIPKNYNKEFIQRAYMDTHRDNIYLSSTLTFDELKSTGMFSNINTELKNEINMYYLKWQNDFNGSVEALAMDWQASLAEDGFITTDTYKLPDPISLLKNNPKRIGVLKRMVRESGWTIQSVIGLIKRNKELIERLEKEIETL
jgi:hypothetical protein